MKQIVHVMILALAVTAGGCGHKAESSAGTNDVSNAETPPRAQAPTTASTGPDTTVYRAKMKHNGVTLSASSMTGGKINVSKAGSSKGQAIVTGTFGGHEVVLTGFALTVDGRSYGYVASGDTIKIADDGRIFRNDRLVPPQ